MLDNVMKNLLFKFDPETAHEMALKGLQFAYRTCTSRFLAQPQIQKPVNLMGLTFPNRAGLAAGFDKSAEYVDALAALGFGFIEVGTLTPRPQMGNARPRLFRLTEQQAIINRMGFNNKGIMHAKYMLENTRYRGILGINVGKNADTPLDNALDDYLEGFRLLWPHASYITMNISSPNTKGLRDLQQAELLSALVRGMKAEQTTIHREHGKYVPLVVKISPDLADDAIAATAEVLLNEKIDGVIATNTTISREEISESPFANETGGLSGMPLSIRSTHVVATLQNILQNRIPIIGSGGVMDTTTAQEKLNAGASLLQLYTGFIYHGPQLIRQIASI